VSAGSTTAALERAENLRLLGRLDEAERTLRDALAATPDDPDLLGALARNRFDQICWRFLSFLK
jgi:Flp pilus assembly protein TadD